MSDPNTSEEERQELDLDALMAKIRKVLAMADPENGVTEGEMDAAAARVQQMLARYNLTLADVEAHNPAIKSEYAKRDFKLYGAVAGDRNWRRLLLSVVARNNFCRTAWYTGSKWAIIIGQPHNIDVVEYLYNYLAGQIEALAKQEIKTMSQGLKRQHWLTWRASYCVGCVENLDARLKQRRWATDEERALVVVKDDELSGAVVFLLGELNAEQLVHDRLNKAAKARGYRDAHNIPLDDAVTAGGAESVTASLEAAAAADVTEGEE